MTIPTIPDILKLPDRLDMSPAGELRVEDAERFVVEAGA